MKKLNYLLLAGGLGIVSLTLGLANEGRGSTTSLSGQGDGGPFQIQLCDTSVCVANHQDTFSVPAEHHLVIEFVSGHCSESESTVFLSTKVRGVTVAHNFVPIRTVNGTEGSFSQTTRLYADAGTDVVVSGNVPFPTCTSVTLSGSLLANQ